MFEGKLYDNDREKYICFHHAVIKSLQFEEIGLQADISVEVDNWDSGCDFRNTGCYACDNEIISCPECSYPGTKMLTDKDLSHVNNNKTEIYHFECSYCGSSVVAQFKFGKEREPNDGILVNISRY